jgi:hypothetical protein
MVSCFRPKIKQFFKLHFKSFTKQVRQTFSIGNEHFSLWQYTTRSYYDRIPLILILDLPDTCLEYESQAEREEFSRYEASLEISAYAVLTSVL